jgi:hypothetical protein
MFRGFVGMALVALLAGPALAQGRGFGGMGTVSALIGNESVQKELKLDAGQVTKANDLAEKNREKFAELREQLQSVDQSERMAKRLELMRPINAATVKALGDFLKPEQITRLTQISYQAQGAMSFLEPDVAKKLNLTDSQKTEIQAISTDAMQEMREIFQSAGDDREAAMKKLNEHRMATLAKVTTKLNDEQQKTWKELTGEPFTVVYPPPQ